MDGRRVALAGARALATGVTGVALAASAGGNEPPVSSTIEIVIRHSKFEPSRIAVPVGVPVTITFRNTDPMFAGLLDDFGDRRLSVVIGRQFRPACRRLAVVGGQPLRAMQLHAMAQRAEAAVRRDLDLVNTEEAPHRLELADVRRIDAGDHEHGGNDKCDP